MLESNKIQLQEIAKNFNITYDTFIYESTKLFIEKKLKKIRIEIYKIGSKYNISSIDEFETLYKQGKIEEHKTIDDYKLLDRLEFQKEKLENILQNLQ